MLRKILCAVVIVGFSIGLAVADEIKGKITKIDGQKITLQYKEKGSKEAKTKDLEAVKDCKVCKKDKEGNEKELDGGLSALKIGEKGQFATLTVDGGKVTKIVVGAGKKKQGT